MLYCYTIFQKFGFCFDILIENEVQKYFISTLLFFSSGGLISFSDYIFLLTVLSTSRRHFEIAFKVRLPLQITWKSSLANQFFCHLSKLFSSYTRGVCPKMKSTSLGKGVSKILWQQYWSFSSKHCDNEVRGSLVVGWPLNENGDNLNVR